VKCRAPPGATLGVALASSLLAKERRRKAAMVPNELPHEPRFRFEGTELEDLLSEWRSFGRACLGSAEEYVRKNPAEALAIAFLAGTTLGSLLGRRQ
jgi:ElaB/YqjD/DUF883 family membrane-anchored ribosome-binding protein